MFCFKCGCQIADDAQFCSKCGTKLNVSIEEKTPQTSLESKELDREAVKIYLSNVLALECSIIKLSEFLDKVNNIINDFESTNYNAHISCYGNNYAWFRYDGKDYHIFLNRYANNEYHLNLRKDSMNYAGECCPFILNMEYLQKDSTWPSKSCTDSLFIELFTSLFIDPFYKKSVKKSFFEAYEQFKKTAPQKYMENSKELEPAIEMRTGILAELDTAKRLLQKAYNINIIPQQFRNIHAIWFIYDYYSTSTETLSSAFLNCNLEKIKQKLDTIIEQQKEIIINQRILVAQNSKMIELNQQTLHRLANIEQNTERAAQYAEIASNNAEACAWIGLATYIKKQ